MACGARLGLKRTVVVPQGMYANEAKWPVEPVWV